MLPFLNDAERKELTARIVQARPPEDARHTKARAEIMKDFHARGLGTSSVCASELIREEVEHLQQLIRIARDEVFYIVEGKSIFLKSKDIRAISDFLEESSKGAIENNSYLQADTTQFNMQQAGIARLRSVVQQESQSGVLVKAAQINRRKRNERQRLWKGLVGKLLLMLVGAIIALGSTFIAQSCQKKESSIAMTPASTTE